MTIYDHGMQKIANKIYNFKWFTDKLFPRFAKLFPRFAKEKQDLKKEMISNKMNQK